MTSKTTLIDRRSFVTLAALASLGLAGLATGCAGAGEASSEGDTTVVETPAAKTDAADALELQAEHAGARAAVVCFSATGHTLAIAESLAAHLGVEVQRIVEQEPYSAEDLDYNDDASRANCEVNDPAARPALAEAPADFSDIDVIYLGYPIWWGNFAVPMRTYVEGADFKGKVVVPFCTSASSPAGASSAANLAELAGTGTWVEGTRFAIGTDADEVVRWADGLALDEALAAAEAEGAQAHANMTIGEEVYEVALENNDCARTFGALLPIELAMTELNGNEKYCYLDEALPADAVCPGTINAGDLMLYGDRCIVVFYETFETSYSYTRIGHVAAPDGLADVVGSGDVHVAFDRV